MDVIWGAKAKHSYFDELDRNNSRLELLLFWRNKENPIKLLKFLKEFQSEK